MEVLFYVTLVIMSLGILVNTMVEAFSIIPKKWRDFVLLILAIGSLILAYQSLKEKIDIEGPLKKQTAAIDSMMSVHEMRIQGSLNKIKVQLDTQDILLSNIRDTEDTILVKIALLDTCIDKHFAGTRQRLIRIEEKLK